MFVWFYSVQVVALRGADPSRLGSPTVCLYNSHSFRFILKREQAKRLNPLMKGEEELACIKDINFNISYVQVFFFC
jgi:hypothetical protein